MDWWLIAFLNSFVSAIYITMNGRFRVPGNSLVYGRSGIVVLAMFPFMFMLDWPAHPLFYVFAVGAAAAAAFGDMTMYDRIAQYGGAVISRIVPLKVWIVFTFWVLVSPSTFFALWDDPMRLFGILAMLALGSISLMSLNRCPVSNTVFMAVIIPVFMWSCSDVMFKGAMLHHETGGLISSFQFVFIVAVIMTLIGGCSVYGKTNTLKQDKKMLKVSLIGAAIFFTLVSGLGLSFSAAPNPSYVVAMMSLNVVWIYLYHRFRGIPDNSNVRAGIFFVLSTVGLVLLTK